MRADTTSVYTQCLKDKGIEESSISQEIVDKLRSYSYILIKNNHSASSEQLRESFGDILKLLLENPDSNFPTDKLFIE